MLRPESSYILIFKMHQWRKTQNKHNKKPNTIKKKNPVDLKSTKIKYFVLEKLT